MTKQEETLRNINFFFRKNKFFYEIHVNLVRVELNYINFFTLINTERIMNGLIYFNVIF